MISFTRIVVTGVLLLVGTPAGANNIIELSLDKKVRLSDIVIIGKEKSRDDAVSRDGHKYININTEFIIKGNPINPVSVETSGMIAELGSDCCDPEISYIFFLRKQKNGKYESVNGRFGVYPIRK